MKNLQISSRGKITDIKIFVLCLSAVFAAATLLSICVGTVRVTPAQIISVLFSGERSTPEARIILYSRLPRTVACLLAGAGLAVSGAIIQAVLANRLASPGIIGVNAGAGLAVNICFAVGAVSGWTIAGMSFLGAMVTVLLLAFVAEKTSAGKVTVILGGVAISSFFTAISEAVVSLSPDVGLMSSDFRVGGFSAVSSARLLPAGILIVIALVLSMLLGNELDVITLGDDSASGVGMNVRRMRSILLITAACLSGASVSFAGLLGFVGLVVPSAVRKFTGSESKVMLPVTAVAGGCFVTVCDVLARIIFRPHEIPAGIIMSFIGGPVFLFLLFRDRKGQEI